jgi:hypothetical protein
MNRDERRLLSLVAKGRMSSAEAERWLAASREERLVRSENRWVFGVAVVAVIAGFWPTVATVSQWAVVHLPVLWRG